MLGALALALAFPQVPPPPPPVAPFDQLIIYFEPGATRLPPTASRIIAFASEYARSHPEVRMTIDAHTDTAGPAAYNLVLSRRRARAVADALVKAGVSRPHLDVRGWGEARPAVNTGDGVSEPLNRRAVIDY